MLGVADTSTSPDASNVANTVPAPDVLTGLGLTHAKSVELFVMDTGLFMTSSVVAQTALAPNVALQALS